MPHSQTSRYTSVAIALHWAIAGLILFMIWLGWNMEENETRLQLHKSIGISILILSVARLAWRWLNPPPALPEGMKPLEVKASHGVHVAFYALMILMPLGGWFVASTGRLSVPIVLFDTVSWPHFPFTDGIRGGTVHDVAEFAHSKGAWLIIGLLALHVAGALKHEFSAEEGVLKRMIPGLFGKAAPPAAPSRGFIMAFGAALILFGAIAAVPLLQRSQAAPPAPGDAVSAPAAVQVDANWVVDYDVSEIRFSGLHEGKPFTGTFGKWTADVKFDPEDLAGSKAFVTVDTASASAGKKLYDDALRAPEWFGVKTFPQATVLLDNFTATDTGYAATATLTIKDVEVTAPLTFTLVMDGGTATLDGTATLSRKALNLGQKSDAAGKYVTDEVTVTLAGKATRK